MQAIYSTQWSQIVILWGGVSSGAQGLIGQPFSFNLSSYFDLVTHNIVVMFKGAALSAFFGTGGLFVSQYTLSQAPVLAGTIIRQNMALGTSFFHGLATFVSVSFSLFLHTFLEIFSFLTGGLAGLLLTIGVLKHKLSSKKFLSVLKNVAIILLAAVILVVLAALVERMLATVLLKFFGQLLNLEIVPVDNLFMLIYR